MKRASAAWESTYGISWIGRRLVPGASYCWIVSSPTTPLEPILQEIRRALEARLYYVALSVSLSLPDICSALEKSPGHERYRKTEARYVDWCERYLAKQFANLTPEDCWVLRGGVVHNAMLVKGRHSAVYDRIIFTLPNPWGIAIHDQVMDRLVGTDAKVIQLDLVTFCNQLVEAAERWYIEKLQDDIVAASLPDVVRLRPNGLAPYCQGVPVIA